MSQAARRAILRVGLVGAGMVAAHHVAAWEKCPGAELVAIADQDEDRARARALGVPGCAAYPSLGAMLRETAIDAVDIATPAPTHADLVRQARAAGLAVLCQKPLTPDLASAQMLVGDLVGGPRVMLHENWRWRGPYQHLGRLLGSGELPRPGWFEMRVESAGLLPNAEGTLPALERQPFFATLPRFLVHEVLGHHLDTLGFLFGPVEIASAHLFRRCAAVRAEDRAEITLSAGGIPGRLIGDFCTPGAPPLPRDRLTLDGRRVLDDWTLTLPRRAPHAFDRASGYQGSYDATIAHFVRALAEGTPFATPVERGAVLLGLVDRVYDLAGAIENQTERNNPSIG